MDGLRDVTSALPVSAKAFTELDAQSGQNDHLESQTLATDGHGNGAKQNGTIRYNLPARFLLRDGTPDYLRMILSSRVYDLVKETPLQRATLLSLKTEANCLLKREDLQPVFSFKIRGAYNMMASLSEEERWRGVVACSAGNHAQGVAISGAKLGIPCTIVMPVATPAIKWRNVERLGSKVVLFGNDFDEAKVECNRLAQSHGLVNIPPYDDPYVIAGQGTLAMEILRQTNLDDVDALFVCVGGGGLLAGVASYVKRIAPEIRVIGVETHDADALTQSLEKGYPVVLSEVGLFADGTAVRKVGDETFRVCKELVDEMISVGTDEICAAIKDIFEDTRSICEPSGALAVAGMKKWHEQQKRRASSRDTSTRNNHSLSNGIRHQDEAGALDRPKSKPTYVGVVSGANMNFDRLRFVAERAELGEGREVLLSAIIPEKAGSFLRLHSHIHPRAITEFNYRYSSSTKAYIYLSFRVKDTKRRKEEVQSIIDAIQGESIDGQQFVARDISGDEMSKSHGRYLIGGRSKVEDERLYRFEFPERPNALFKFLHGLDAGFNISLFHYRNHGSDLGKVLVGIQVPQSSEKSFQSFLDSLNYPYVDESQNVVYKQFLT